MSTHCSRKNQRWLRTRRSEAARPRGAPGAALWPLGRSGPFPAAPCSTLHTPCPATQILEARAVWRELQRGCSSSASWMFWPPNDRFILRRESTWTTETTEQPQPPCPQGRAPREGTPHPSRWKWTLPWCHDVKTDRNKAATEVSKVKMRTYTFARVHSGVINGQPANTRSPTVSMWR